MSWGSSVPAAIAALYAAAVAAPSLAAVEVSDGPILTAGEHPAGVLTIGYPGGEEDTAAEAQAAPEGWAGQPDRESYTISCAASVANGDNDMAAARAAAYAIVGALGGILAADHTLGGVVLRAVIAGSTLHQSQTNVGALVTVTIHIAVDAFTQL